MESNNKSLEIQPLKFRCRMCSMQSDAGLCPYGSKCMYAHSVEEFRTVDDNIRDGITTMMHVRKFLQKEKKAAGNEGSMAVNGGVKPAGTTTSSKVAAKRKTKADEKKENLADEELKVPVNQNADSVFVPCLPWNWSGPANTPMLDNPAMIVGAVTQPHPSMVMTAPMQQHSTMLAQQSPIFMMHAPMQPMPIAMQIFQPTPSLAHPAVYFNSSCAPLQYMLVPTMGYI